jgi:hypothetical protein
MQTLMDVLGQLDVLGESNGVDAVSHEIRTIAGGLEVRAQADQRPTDLGPCGAIQFAQPLYGVRETIAPGAFTHTLGAISGPCGNTIPHRY